MIWKYVEILNGVKSGLGKITAKSLHLSVEFGLIFTIIGFIVSIIGVEYLNEGVKSTTQDINSNKLKYSNHIETNDDLNKTKDPMNESKT